jgi:hypothetical protein
MQKRVYSFKGFGAGEFDGFLDRGNICPQAGVKYPFCLRYAIALSYDSLIMDTIWFVASLLLFGSVYRLMHLAN